MAVKLVRYRYANQERWGVLEGQSILQISDRDASLADVLQRHGARLLGGRKASGKRIPAAKAELLSPVTAPCNIVCQGKNYTAHIRETGFMPRDKDYNLFFTKADSALTGPRGAILRPPGVRLLDYELELGLVIGAPITRKRELREEQLGQHVLGLVMANDVSARDIQVPQGQWFKGKSYRTFCPVGPWILLTTPAELARLSELELTLRVNGEIRQKAVISQMIYTPAETLSELSGIMELRAGDLVLTGTPAGVAMQVPGGLKRKLAQFFLSERSLMRKFVETQAASGRYLKDGDVIHSSIATPDGALDLGMQELTVVSA